MSVPTKRDDVTKPSDFQQEIYADGVKVRRKGCFLLATEPDPFATGHPPALPHAL
jgi:hypothetical protein